MNRRQKTEDRLLKGRTVSAVFSLLCALVIACTQSPQVFAPVNNVAPSGSGTPQAYTLTLNVSSSNTNHQNQPVSALLFRGGTLQAAQYNAGVTTDGSGAASFTLNGVDVNGCPTSTPAALEAGNYTLYFAIQYNAETATSANPLNGLCGANGWINSSSGGNLYGTRAELTIASDTTYVINNVNLAQLRQHTFDLNAGGGEYACLVTDLSVTSYAPTRQPLALYTRNGTGTTTGAGATTFLLPVGTYRYFCSLGANTTHFETGSDSGASGTLTVSGAGTTALVAGDFSPL